MTEFDDLADMAVKVRRSLHWSALLLLAMVLVLVIDLQLKRSIARQAIVAAETLSRAVTAAAGRESGGRSGTVDPPASDRDNGGGGRGDHVDGSTPVAEGSDQAGDPVEAAAARHPSSRRKRPPGNG